MTFTPNKYHEIIFEWLRSGKGDAVIESTAGSGKTSTLVEIANRIDPGVDVGFFAFGNRAAEELRHRLPRHAHSSTIHVLGKRSLLRHYPHLQHRPVNQQKMRQVIDLHIRELSGQWSLPQDEWFLAKKYLTQLTRMCMYNLTDTKNHDAVRAIANRYGIVRPRAESLSERLIGEVKHVLRTRQGALKAGSYDFDDMLYVPSVYKLPLRQHDIICVDEAQDLSPLQLSLVLRVSRRRRIFVGDSKQAIFNYAGADADSLERIIQATNATRLSLSISYRCPRKIVQLAQQLAPEMEAAPGAAEGHIHFIKVSELGRHIQDGDLILCRFIAPTIQVALNLIHEGIPTIVRGGDIGEQLADLSLLIYDRHLNDWEQNLQHYWEKEQERIYQETEDNEAEKLLENKSSVILALRILTREAVAKGAQTKEQVRSFIEAFFDDKARGIVTCSTIHKAKGEENSRVFLLYPKAIIPKNIKSAEDAKAEACIQFVALTRTKDTLYFVDADTEEE